MIESNVVMYLNEIIAWFKDEDYEETEEKPAGLIQIEPIGFKTNQ